jgi:hypothetical protein
MLAVNDFFSGGAVGVGTASDLLPKTLAVKLCFVLALGVTGVATMTVSF